MLTFNPKIYIREASSDTTNIYTVEELIASLASDWELVGETLEKPTISVAPGKTANLSTGVQYTGSDKIDFEFKSIDVDSTKYENLKTYTNTNKADIMYVDIDNVDPSYILVKNVQFSAKLTYEGGEFSTIDITGTREARLYTDVINFVELNRATIEGLLRLEEPDGTLMINTDIEYTNPRTGALSIVTTTDTGYFNFTFYCNKYATGGDDTIFSIDGGEYNATTHGLAGTSIHEDLVAE